MDEKFKQWFFQHNALITELKNMLEPAPPEPPPPLPPREDVKWWPHRFETAGVTAFPLSIRPREYIRDLVQYLQEYGYNSATVGAQAWGFKQVSEIPILPSGPVEGPEWEKNLETMLDETARHENFWIQLITTFGYKHYDTDPDGQEYAWHRQHADRIIEIIKANDFRHIYWSVMNEFKHPLTDDDIGQHDIFRLGQYLKGETGFPVSTDHSGREKDKDSGKRIWKAYWPQAWLGFDYFNWHTPRNPEPTEEEFKTAAERWEGSGKALLYNETVCYASDADMARWPHLRGAGTIAGEGKVEEEAQKGIIRELKRRIKAAGQRSRFFFHSIWLGIRGGLDAHHGWLPKY